MGKRAELLSNLQDIMSQAKQLRKRKLTNKEQKKIDEQSESGSFASSASSDTGVEIGSVGESSRIRRESDPGPSRYQTNKKVARLDHNEVKLQQKKSSWVPNYVLKEK